MIFSQNKQYKYFKYIVSHLLIFLLAAFIVLRFYVPQKITNYLANNPDTMGFMLKTEKIDYSILSGFHFRSIVLSKPGRDQDHLEIDSLFLNVDFVSSVIKQKPVIDFIEIENIKAGISSELVSELKGRNKTAVEQPTKGNRITGIELKELVINNLDLNYDSKYALILSRILLRPGDLQKLDDVYYKSNVTIFDKQIEIENQIKRNGTNVNATVTINTPTVVLVSADNITVPALKLITNIQANTENNITASADTNIYETNKLMGNSAIDIVFKKEQSELLINKIRAYIFNLIKLNVDGKITKVSDYPQLNIEGGFETLDLKYINKLIAHKYGTNVSANFSENSFTLTGSLIDDLKLKSHFILNDVYIGKDDNKLNAHELSIDIGYKYDLQNNSGALNVNANTDDFTGGRISLSSEIKPKEEIIALKGSIRAADIDLDKIYLFRNYATGKLLNLNSGFSGTTDSLDFISDLTASDLTIILSDSNEINISHLHTTDKIHAKYKPSGNPDKIDYSDFRVNNLEFENLTYNDFQIDKGSLNAHVDDLLSVTRQYNLNLNGNHLVNKTLDTNLNNIELIATHDNSVENNIRGSLQAVSGRYTDYEISDLISQYKYNSQALEISDTKFTIDNYGITHISNINMPVEQEKPFPSKIILKRGQFESSDNTYKLNDFNIDLINTAGDSWSGDIYIDSADILSVKLMKLRSILNYNQRGYRIDRINAGILGGNLSGYLSNINNGLIFSVTLKDSKLAGRENVLSADAIRLNYKGSTSEGHSLPEGSGTLSIDTLFVQDYKEESELDFKTDITTASETLSLLNSLINNKDKEVVLSFTAEVDEPFSDGRQLNYKTEKMNITEIKKFLNPYLPAVLRFGEITGDMNLELTGSSFPKNTTVEGIVDFNNINMKGDPFGTLFNLENLNGRLNLSTDGSELKGIDEVIRRHTKDYKQAFDYTKSLTRNQDSNVRIEKLQYGFFTLENIRLLMNIVKNKFTVRELSTNIFDGKLTSSGFYDFGDNDNTAGKFYFLLDDISLKNITDSIPGTEGYISGRVNGIVSMVQKKRKTSNLDGLFNFWTFSSKKEDRVVGKAFLQRLGAKERFLLGSSKNYDKGVLNGYINNGVITFNELELSNRIFGIRDLNIKVHNRRNSISVAHLLSVIRETARRANAGSLDLQFQN